jgi:Zn-dependent protease with chaperone function
MMRLALSSLFTLTILLGFTFGIIALLLLNSSGYDLTTTLTFTLAFNAALWLFSPRITDFTLTYINQMTFIPEAEYRTQYPELAQLVDEVCAEHHIPWPKMGIIHDKNPTAFTYGSVPSNARVIMSEGIFTYLTVPQARAVLAHELGHIVHYDFILMTLASTLLQVLYNIYSHLDGTLRRNTSSKKSREQNKLAAIAFLCYVFYLIGTYLLLFLSRTREYMADNFAAQKTSAADLANALFRIAYGIMEETDTEKTAHLLNATRTLGIVDTLKVEQNGTAYKLSKGDEKALSNTLLFDTCNPWATLAELSSTHPLTGKRILALTRTAQSPSQFSTFNPTRQLKTLNITRATIWKNFLFEFFLSSTPALLLATSFAGIPLAYSLMATGIAGISLVFYFYPQDMPAPTTILALMSNPLASPVRGTPAILNGIAIGRGESGNRLTPNLMFQDATGLLYLQFNYLLGAFTGLYKAFTATPRLLNQPAEANGWFFRGASGSLTLKSYTSNLISEKASPIATAIIGNLIIVAAGIAFYAYLPDYSLLSLSREIWQDQVLPLLTLPA